MIFFLIEDMSVMCLFLLTNFVGLKGKELQFLENFDFSDNSTVGQEYLFFTYSGKF